MRGEHHQRSLAKSSVFLYGNISTFRSDWREIEYRRIAVGFRLWIGYQIFTYVKNKEIELSAQPHEVFGMLLYAKTDEAVLPNNSYKMSGNTISVKTLDLDCDFSDVDCLQEGLKESEDVKTNINKRCREQFSCGLITLNDWRAQIGESMIENPLFDKLKFDMSDEELDKVNRVFNTKSGDEKDGRENQKPSVQDKGK